MSESRDQSEGSDDALERETPKPKAGDLPSPAFAVDDDDTLIGMSIAGGSGEIHAAGQTFTRDQIKEVHERLFGRARRTRRIEMGLDPEPSSRSEPGDEEPAQ